MQEGMRTELHKAVAYWHASFNINIEDGRQEVPCSLS